MSVSVAEAAGPQWTIVDNDASLLERAGARERGAISI
jgi:hypothetical protein